MALTCADASAQALDIRIGNPGRVGDKPGGFPNVKKLTDGTILVAASEGGHQPITGESVMRLRSHLKSGGGLSDEELTKAGIPKDINLCRGYWAVRSSDGGKSWSPVTNDVARVFAASSCGTFSELADGTLLANYVFSINTADGQELITWRSNDKGQTWSKARFTPLICPPQRDLAWGEGVIGGCFYSRILDLPDKSLLLFGHTQFEGDRKYRVVVLRSTDQAKSFHYYATVAYEDNSSSTLRPLGFCEPEAVRLKTGEILCFMRTAEYEPLFVSRSTNDARTWSSPQRIGVDGILPTPVLLDNGVLALSYGRPGVWLIFSTDNGRWWTDKRCIWTWNSLWGEGHLPKTRHYSTPGYHTFERSDCNARMTQIAPNKLLLVYNAPIDATSSPNAAAIDYHEGPGQSGIWGVIINVTRN